MNQYILLLIALLILVVIIFIYALLYQRYKYTKRLLLEENKQLEFADKCSMYLKETMYLKEQVIQYEQEEYERNGGFNTTEGKVKLDPIYEGKRALIGDKLTISSNNTKNVLKSLGFDVDVVSKKEDVIQRVKYQNNYDVIFTNNLYRDGSGPECLKELKELKNFSTPVIIHTVDMGKEEHFVKGLGFNGYIEKPVTQEKVKKVLKNIFKEENYSEV